MRHHLQPYDLVKLRCPACGWPQIFRSMGATEPGDWERSYATAYYESHEAPPRVLSDVNHEGPHECERCSERYVAALELKTVSLDSLEVAACTYYGDRSYHLRRVGEPRSLCGRDVVGMDHVTHARVWDRGERERGEPVDDDKWCERCTLIRRV